MTEILALLQNIAPVVCPTVLKQIGQVIYGLLISNGHTTALETSHWMEQGELSNYPKLVSRPVALIANHLDSVHNQLWKVDHEYNTAGYKVLFGKPGNNTSGLGRF